MVKKRSLIVKKNKPKTLLKRSSHKQRRNLRAKKKQPQSINKQKQLEQKLLTKSQNKSGNKSFSKVRKSLATRLNKPDTKWTTLLKQKRKTSRLSPSEIKDNSLAIKRPRKMRKLTKRRTNHRGTSLQHRLNSREVNRTKGKLLVWKSKILARFKTSKTAEKKKTPTNKIFKNWSTKSKIHANSWLNTPRHRSSRSSKPPKSQTPRRNLKRLQLSPKSCWDLTALKSSLRSKSQKIKKWILTSSFWNQSRWVPKR